MITKMCANIARFLSNFQFSIKLQIVKTAKPYSVVLAGHAIDNRFEAVIIPPVQFDQQGIHLLYYCMCFGTLSLTSHMSP
jgi:hypothetical protein